MKIRHTFLLLALGMLLFSCQPSADRDAEQLSELESGAQESARDPGSVDQESLARSEDAPGSAAGSESGGQDDSVLPESPPGGGEKVIRTALIQVRVGEEEFGDRFEDAAGVAGRFGGHVAETQRSNSGDGELTGSVTLRIPSESFDEALSALRKLGEVVDEEQTGQDVTQEFVDLEARLRHAQSQEAFYIRLMDKAATVADLVQIQQQLSEVQLQIEQIKGRLQFLKDRTDLSTVTIRMFEPGAGPQPARGRLGEAWARAWDGFQGTIAGLIVALGWVTPLVILAAGSFLIWRLVRRAKPKPTQA